MKWVSKAANSPMHSGDTGVEEGGGVVDLGITHLDSYQGSAGFQAPFIPCLDVGPLSSLLYLFLASRVLVRDSCAVVLCALGELSRSHSSVT